MYQKLNYKQNIDNDDHDSNCSSITVSSENIIEVFPKEVTLEV